MSVRPDILMRQCVRGWFAVMCLMAAGCTTFHSTDVGCDPWPHMPDAVAVPRELDKAILPSYVIEPPDVLWIEATHVAPRSPYKLQSLDVLRLAVQNTLPGHPVDGNFSLEPGGTIDLGTTYGRIHLSGLTVAEASDAISQHLKQHLRDPRVSVTLAQIAGVQQLSGEHIVGPDGTITLGIYGRVPVVGMTVDEARLAVEQHLATFLDKPRVSLSVFAYNSKKFYVIMQGAGLGDKLVSIPSMGNETVIDALSQVQGLSDVSSKKIWIARPGRNRAGGNQILPVDWLGITQRGEVETNFQVLPGDRIYIAEDKFVAFDVWVAKVTSPLERIFSFTLLGTGTVSRLSGKVLENRAVQIQASSF